VPAPDVAAGFFELLGVGMAAGRTFTLEDRAGALPVAIVNRSFERRYFPDDGALGKRIRMDDGPDAPWLTIVGVTPDLFSSGLSNENPEAVYRPLAQTAAGTFVILARARSGDAIGLTPAVRAALRALDRDVPISDIGTLASKIDGDNWYYAVFGALFVAFGGAALFLASLGLYGVMSFSVNRRRRELGIRMAVGASGRDLVRLVLRQGMTQTAVGLCLGTAFALAVSSLISALLFGVEPRDPLVFATVVSVLLATAALACWVPALRASRSDPLEALRSE
jgi:hypothetical protein